MLHLKTVLSKYLILIENWPTPILPKKKGGGERKGRIAMEKNGKGRGRRERKKGV